MKRTPSRFPQRITPHIWYYEERRAIHVYLDAEFIRGIYDGTTPSTGGTLSFKIPRSKLKRSLFRMR